MSGHFQIKHWDEVNVVTEIHASRTHYDHLAETRTYEITSSCVFCGAAIHGVHLPTCLQVRARRPDRVDLVAWLYLLSRHPEMPNNEAAVHHDHYFHAREMTPDLTRDELKEGCERMRKRVEMLVAGITKHAHLDKDWDGKGIRPARKMALRDAFIEGGGPPRLPKSAGALA